MKAIWHNKVIAESNKTVVIEGNHYFPATSANYDYLKPSDKTTVCPWKGTATYYSLIVGKAENPDAAWYYVKPKVAAQEIEGHIAFWNGVQIVED